MKSTDFGVFKRSFIINVTLWGVLIFYFLGIELLYQLSKVSVISKVYSALEITKFTLLILLMLLLIVTVLQSLLTTLSIIISRLSPVNMANFNWPAVFPLTVFTLVNFVFLNRWTYSSFQHDVAKAPDFVGWLALLLLSIVSYFLYKNNKTQLQKFASKHSRKFLPALGAVVALAIATVFYTLFALSDLKDFGRGIVAQKKPNVIVLTFDMLEFWRTSIGGSQRETMPKLDKIKDQFHFFSRFRANAIDSRAGNMILFNGKSPATTGVYGHPNIFKGRHSIEHLPRLLYLNDYYVANLGSEPYSNPEYANMLGGFTEVNGEIQLFEKLAGTQLESLFYNSNTAHALYFALETIRDYKIYFQELLGLSHSLRDRKDVAFVFKSEHDFSSFLENLDRISELNKPFFFHYHAVYTHTPITTTKYQKYSKIKKCPEMLKKYKKCNGEKLSEQEEWDLYDDNLLAVDEDIIATLELLKEKGIYDNTLLIVTTDHEFHWQTSGRPLFLMIKLPGQNTSGKIHDVSAWALDVAPTIADVLGFPEQKWMEGKSLLPVMQADADVNMADYNDRVFHILDRGQISVIKNNLRFSIKGIHWKPKMNYFDATELKAELTPIQINKNLEQSAKALKEAAEEIIDRMQ